MCQEKYIHALLSNHFTTYFQAQFTQGPRSNLKLGPSNFTWGFGFEIIKMTCHPTWHTLWRHKIGPKIIKGMLLGWRPNFFYWAEEVYLFSNQFLDHHNHWIKNVIFKNKVKQEAKNVMHIFFFMHITFYVLLVSKCTIIFFLVTLCVNDGRIFATRKLFMKCHRML